MASLPKLAAIFAILLLFCLATTRVDAEEFVICNGAKFAPNSNTARGVSYVINDLVQNTNRYYEYKNESPPSLGKVYGLGTCNRGINPGDCTGCLTAAKNVMARCTYSVGAQVRLDQNCFLRYEIYKF